MTAVTPTIEFNPNAKSEFRDSSVFIKNAYAVNGKIYDITYDTSRTEVQKLKGMEPEKLVRNLQEQMEAYLVASGAVAKPEETKFEITSSNNVFAVTGERRVDISDRMHQTAHKTMKAFAEAFRNPTAVTPPTPPEPEKVEPAPAKPENEEAAAPADEAPAPVAEDEAAPKYDSHLTEGVGIMKGFTYAPAMVGSEGALGQICGSSGLNMIASSGALNYGLSEGWKNLKHTYHKIKAGEYGEAAESAVKTASCGAQAISGSAYLLGAVASVPATLGPIAGCVAAGAALLINLKDLLMFLTGQKPLPEKWGWNFLANLAMFLGPLLLLAGAFSNPVTAIGVLIGFTLFALTMHIIAHRKEMWEKISEVSLLQKILYVAGFAIAVGVTAGNVTGAQYIAMAAVAATGIPKIAAGVSKVWAQVQAARAEPQPAV